MPRWDVRRIAVMTGAVGVGLIVLGSLLAALAYRGRLDEPYSFLNHFVSELGEVGVSDWAAVFNLGLIAGGLCLTVFMLALAVDLRHWFSLPFGLIGLVTGLSGALVGVFPMNDMDNHVTVAMTFFNTGWIATGLFALYVLLARKHSFPRWLACRAWSRRCASWRSCGRPRRGPRRPPTCCRPEGRPGRVDRAHPGMAGDRQRAAWIALTALCWATGRGG